MPNLLVAPDKFRGTISAVGAAAAMSAGGSAAGWSVRQVPLSDGGEGLLDVLERLGGERRYVDVEGPLGKPVTAEWLLAGTVAVLEMARASGLLLAGGPPGNDVLSATTRGTGALLVDAARALAAHQPTAPPSGGRPSSMEIDGTSGRPTIVLGLGGSATTDGGRGALDVIEEAGGLGDVDLVGACDVDVGFVEAATRFGPQKGADPDQVRVLEQRLEGLADRYERDYGIDVRAVPGAGAAGGLGAAVVVLGGTLRSGYEVVAELVGLSELLATSQAVVTGEGSLDATSFMGKVVGSVLRDASSLGVPALVVAGQVTDEAAEAARLSGARVVSLTERFGKRRSMNETASCIREVVEEELGALAR